MRENLTLVCILYYRACFIVFCEYKGVVYVHFVKCIGRGYFELDKLVVASVAGM